MCTFVRISVRMTLELEQSNRDKEFNNYSTIEIFQFSQECMVCPNRTRVCFIVKSRPFKLCSECAIILKGLIKE